MIHSSAVTSNMHPYTNVHVMYTHTCLNQHLNFHFFSLHNVILKSLTQSPHDAYFSRSEVQLPWLNAAGDQAAVSGRFKRLFPGRFPEQRGFPPSVGTFRSLLMCPPEGDVC